MNLARSIARPLALALGLALAGGLSLALPVAAQWLWKDEAGHVVASDQPPPVDTPPSRILKSPRAGNPAPAAAPSTDPAKAEAPRSTADKELDFRQRQKDAAEAAKKNDEEAAKARAMQENCTVVRGNLAGLQAGGRAARVNERGEKTYLDDAQRQAEINRAQGQIAQYCKN